MCQTVLDLDQARHFVGPDLGPNCLQKLSADDTSRQRVDMSRIHVLSVIFCVFQRMVVILLLGYPLLMNHSISC